MTRGDRRRRDEGAALVLVLVFMLGAVMLVATVLALSQDHVRSEMQRHRIKSLHAVLRAGAATALEEINRDLIEGGYDPGRDGVGALLGPEAGGLHQGLELRAEDGALLGAFRTTLRVEEGRDILVVVAAYPGFTPTPDQLLAGAELEVVAGRLEFGDAAFEVLGAAGGRDPRKLDKRIRISKADLLIADPTYTVPAVNISDPAFHAFAAEALQREVDEGEATIVGGSTATPAQEEDEEGNGNGNGNGNAYGRERREAASGADTIDNAPSSHRMNLASLEALSLGLVAYVERTVPGATEVRLPAAGGVVTLAEGTYRLRDDLKLERGVTLRGSGTLIVDEKLSIEAGAALEWDGTVIVSGVEESKAELRVKRGGALSVEGVLAVEGSAKKSKLTLDGSDDGEPTRVHVTGALLILTDALLEDDDDRKDDSGEVKVKGGAELQVDGALLVLAEHVHVKVHDRGRLLVRGSLSLLIPADARKGLHKLEVKKGGDAQVLYDPAAVDGAVRAVAGFALDVFGERGAPLPARFGSYFERGLPALLAEQEAAIESGAAGLEGR